MARFDPYRLSTEQLEEAVRFMRDEDDAMDTVPSELQALTGEAASVARQTRSAQRLDMSPGPVSRQAPAAAAPDNKTFLAVVVGVSLVCMAALGFVLLGQV